MTPFFEKHCFSCHGKKRQSGDLSLHDLAPDMKATTSAGRWAMVLDKLAKGEMPPKSRPKPSDKEIEAIRRWIKAEMKRAGKHFARRQLIINGNEVPHEKLFDPNFTAPFDNPARIRRLSPEIYDGILRDLARNARGLGQPFTSDPRFIFKDMGAPKMDEPTTVQLIRNAVEIVKSRTKYKIENGKLRGVGSVPREFLKLLDESEELTDENVEAGIKLQFRAVLSREPTKDELARFVKLMHKNVKEAGRGTGVRYSLATVFLLPEAVFRWELGTGQIDATGRVRLAPREIAFALAYALTDRRPDAKLLADAAEGKLDTTDGVAAAAKRMLDDPRLDKPRILRFFQEYFGYEKARSVFQEQKENPDHDARRLVEDTDRLISYILEKDKDVLSELLTTTRAFVAYKVADETKKRRAQELKKFLERKRKDPKRYKNKQPRKIGKSVYLSYNLKDFPDNQPVDLPAEERAGILTQPAWLAAFAKTGENHAILRGKWVRERLLGKVVPDIPITVDAQLPEAPDKTLRERMAVTQQKYCWQCHEHMNPVGLPFEMYDYVGRFRTKELNEPVDATGKIEGSGDKDIEGKVKNAVEMLRKLADSELVEQVFVRHAFRYFLGRNENLGDGPSLRKAHQAYKRSGGSMKALIIALLSSDSFLYRVPTVASEKNR